MKKIFNILFYSYSVLIILIIVSCLNGYLSFGNGLGDLYYLIFSIVVFFIALIILFLKNVVSNKGNYDLIFGIFLMVFTIIILILKLTVLKGAESYLFDF